MKKIAISSMSVSEIESLLKSKPDAKTSLRLVNILAIAKGDSSGKAEDLSLLSHNQICIWAKRFNENGLAGLKDKVKTGRKSRISGTATVAYAWGVKGTQTQIAQKQKIRKE